MRNNERDPADFEDLVRLADYSHRSFDQRRSYEWKVTLGFWATVVALTTQTDWLPGNGFARIALIFAIYVGTWILLGEWWLIGLTLANRQDKNRAGFYREAAHNLLVGGDPKFNEVAERFPLRELNEPSDRHWILLDDWAPAFQFWATEAILTLCFIVAWAGAEPAVWR